jgi:hypothetical protein
MNIYGPYVILAVAEVLIEVMYHVDRSHRLSKIKPLLEQD